MSEENITQDATPPAAPVEVPPVVESLPSAITLSGEAVEQVTAARTALVTSKIDLADAVLKLDATKEQTRKTEQDLLSAISNAARAVGIDPEDPSKGRWHFNLDDMTFRQVENVSAPTSGVDA